HRRVGGGGVDRTARGRDSTGLWADGKEVDDFASGVRCTAEQLGQLRRIFKQVRYRVYRLGRGSDARGRIADVRQAQIGEQACKLIARNMFEQRTRGWSESCGCRHQIADDGEQ